MAMRDGAVAKIKLRDERKSQIRGCGLESDGRSYDDVLHRVTHLREEERATQAFPETL